MSETFALQRRINMEKRIIKSAIRELLENGFLLSVNDGESVTLRNSNNAKAIFSAMMTTDENYLIAKKESVTGRVFFVYGNDGYDVINDYSVSLEPYLTETNELSNKLSD